jgi:pyruvate formate lyase activating enzyme
VGSKIRSKNYGWVSGLHMDPIEKKPLYHFFPGRQILSLGSFGCNLKCNFCQNWKISQACELNNFQGSQMAVDEIVELAKLNSGNIGIAYTYNEPTVGYEFMFDLAREIKKEGLQNVMVSNGYINAEPLKKLIPFIDAFNIDLKGFTENFYREMTGGSLKPVLESLKTIKKQGKHLEITHLLIPRKNDDIDKFQEMVLWIARELGKDTVLHLTRYFPRYKQSVKATEVSGLVDFWSLAKNLLNHVYLGNVDLNGYSDTICSNCGSILIDRKAYAINLSGLTEEGNCMNCNTKTNITTR